MENENEGPTAAFSTTLSVPLFAEQPNQMTQEAAHLSPRPPDIMGDEDNRFSPPLRPDAAASLDTPIHAPFVNHFEPSNLRGSLEEDIAQVQHLSSSPSNGVKAAANILANGYNDQYLANLYAQSYAVLDTMTTDDPFTDDGERTNLGEEEERGPMQAYAKLTMPDGDYYVTSLKVILGRDMDYWKRYTKEKKRAEKAQQALEEYALEPSQPSQPDDLDRNAFPSSKSSQSLVGRPSGGLPSNYSEQGGAVSYPAHSDDEDYTRPSRRRRRKTLKSRASSISVAPASLHPNMLDLGAANIFGTESGHVADSPGFVGIHPANRDDIRLISKEHLCFEYNFDEEHWQLKVLGNRAFVNNELHQKGSTVVLNHDDEIIVTSVSIKFRLPENRNSPGPSRGTFADSRDFDLSEDDEEALSELSSTSGRRLSVSEDEIGSEQDEEEEDQPRAQKTTKKTPKIKLSLKKARKESRTEKDKPVKLSLKQKRAEQEVGKRPEKGKKPKAASKQPSKAIEEPGKPDPVVAEATAVKADDPVKEEKASPQPTVPPAPLPAPVIEPGSIFEGVAAEELPQKRKGPGRPPKNGLISKRDQSFVKRKLKEYEKRGQAPPPMDELVAIVRAENKAKELAAKAAARGEMMPDMSVMPSIEIDGSRPEGVATLDPDKAAVPSEPTRRPSPKPKRVVKSPSPMKPESEYTEDEMKKPTVTYVHILDEVLRDHPTGKADLQEIYDRICKRYPYFKYRVNTAGWQSSVRHNLLQHDRFVENGRSGKGRLWTINFDCPIDREKKRRVTPPPRPQVSMQNGQYGPGQYGAQTQAPGHPNGPYYSPYTQTSFVQTQRPPQQAQPIPKQPVPQQQAAPQQSPSASAFQEIVARILVFRSTYLSRFPPDSEAYKEHDAIFNSCTNHVSAIFHGTTEAVELNSEEEKKVYKELENIVKVYQGKEVSVQPGNSATPQPAPQISPGQQAQQGTLQPVPQTIAAQSSTQTVLTQQPLLPQPPVIAPPAQASGQQPSGPILQPGLPQNPAVPMAPVAPVALEAQGQPAPQVQANLAAPTAEGSHADNTGQGEKERAPMETDSGAQQSDVNPLKRTAEDDPAVDEAKRVKTA